MRDIKRGRFKKSCLTLWNALGNTSLYHASSLSNKLLVQGNTKKVFSAIVIMLRNQFRNGTPKELFSGAVTAILHKSEVFNVIDCGRVSFGSRVMVCNSWAPARPLQGASRALRTQNAKIFLKMSPGVPGFGPRKVSKQVSVTVGKTLWSLSGALWSLPELPLRLFWR